MLHGIIDIGSNTIRMAVYLIEGGHFEQLMKRKMPDRMRNQKLKLKPRELHNTNSI